MTIVPSLPPHVALVVAAPRPCWWRRLWRLDPERSFEYGFNTFIALELARHLSQLGIEAVHVQRVTKRGDNGVSTYQTLIDDVNATGALMAIQLHVSRAWLSDVKGCEVLHAQGSKPGMDLASHLYRPLRGIFRRHGRDNRIQSGGVHGVPLHRWHGPFLGLTTMPAVIVSPGFTSNVGDLETIRQTWRDGTYVSALIGGIVTYLREQGALE